MKFLARLVSCWGGAIVNPAADTEDRGAYSGRRSSKRLAKLHWKPKLNAISENTPMLRRYGSRRIGEKKRAVKANRKAKAPAKDLQQPSLAEYYWYYPETKALPELPPMTYLF